MDFVDTAKFALKSLFGQLIFIVLLIVCIDNLPIMVGQYLQKLQWLPHSLLVVAAIMAVQFGHSRLFIASCLLFSSLYIGYIPKDYLTVEQVQHFLPLVLISSMAGLLWERDRGFSIQGLAASISLMIASCTVVILTSMYLQSLSMPWLNQFFQQSTTVTALKLNGAEVLLMLIVQFAGLMRFMLKPTNRHAALMLVALSVTGMMLYFGQLLPQLMLSMLATAFCVLILHDSYNMAFKDELTGIKGRRALMQYAATLGKKYTVVMGDVDKFKRFNDKYGHEVGDQVLKMVATCVDGVGGGGKAFRYGGEEFTIVFQHKTAQQAKVFVEEVREAIGARPFLLRGTGREQNNAKGRNGPTGQKRQEVFVTSSFGIAERDNQLTEFEDVMKAADQALYKAKAAGRNCVQLAKQ